MFRTKTILTLVLSVLVGAALASCSLFNDTDPVDGTWKLVSVAGTTYNSDSGLPWSAYNIVYKLENRTGRINLAGKYKGDDFDYYQSGSRITISGASGEGLVDDTYTCSVSSDTMTWQYEGEDAYVFVRYYGVFVEFWDSFSPIVTEGGWVEDSLLAGEVDGYAFDAVAGVKYQIQWNDSHQGNGNYNCDVRVRAFTRYSSDIINQDSGYTYPVEYTATSTEKVYLQVSGWYTSSSGTYAIRVTCNVSTLSDSNINDVLENPDANVWINFGNNPWLVAPSYGSSNSNSMVSGDIADSHSSTLQTTFTGDYIAFDWRVSSENTHDELTFYVDGVTMGYISGEKDWSRTNFTVSQGFHTVKWVYSKDGSVSSGSDCGWVDNLRFGSNPVPSITKGAVAKKEPPAAAAPVKNPLTLMQGILK